MGEPRRPFGAFTKLRAGVTRGRSDNQVVVVIPKSNRDLTCRATAQAKEEPWGAVLLLRIRWVDEEGAPVKIIDE